MASHPSPLLRDTVSCLDTWFPTSDSLSSAQFILDSLSEEHTNLLRQNARLETRLAKEATRASGRTHEALLALSEVANKVGRTREGVQEAGVKSGALVAGLAALAQEVAQVEKVRVYLQTLLQLESSVTDMEEHLGEASRARAGKLKSLGPAVEAFKNTTALAAEFARLHPQWWRLLLAVDLRLDQGLAAIRPALDHIYRASLASVKWPPPLVPSMSEDSLGGAETELDLGGQAGADFKRSFGLLSLLQVVQSARDVRSRPGGGVVLEAAKGGSLDTGPLWTFQALVEPIAAQAEPHLSQWVDQPEFAFALCLKVAQEHVGLADAVLQTLLEKAGLVGVSAREEWVKAVAGTLAGAHLRDCALPHLMQKLEEDREAYAVLWLLTVDQALKFDKQMRKLVAGTSGIRLGLTGSGQTATVGVFAEREAWLKMWSRLELEDVQRKAKAILVKESGWETIHTRGHEGDDWLDDAESYGPSLREYRPPSNARGVLGLLQETIERCRALPRADQRLPFVEGVTLPLIGRYRKKVKDKCQEVQGLTSLAHDTDLVKIAAGLNGLHFIEQHMHDWGDELFFVELHAAAVRRNRDSAAAAADGWDLDVGGSDVGESERGGIWGGTGSIFDRDVQSYRELQEEWLDKLSGAMVRQFESRTEGYQRNRKGWSADSHPSIGQSPPEERQDGFSVSPIPSPRSRTFKDPSIGDNDPERLEKRKRRVTFNLKNLPEQGELGRGNRAGSSSSTEPPLQSGSVCQDVDVSPALVEALSALRSQLLALHVALDEELFTTLWRKVSAAIDRLLLEKVVLDCGHFTAAGTAQLQADVAALASVFRPFTTRPHAHFRLLADALTLLTLPSHAVRSLQVSLAGHNDTSSSDSELRHYGIRRLSVPQAETILKHR